jgi:RNA-directed DNA polymerase
VKRIGHIYENVCDINNIKQAALRASLGKRDQKRVRRVLDNLNEAAAEIQRMLSTKTYKPSPYVIKTVRDGARQKERTIYKPRFYPDQTIHWALMLQLEPVIMRGMYRYSCGSVPGRGTSDGQNTLRNWLDTDRRGTKYCLKMDVSKFYPSVDNEILKQMFRRKIKDEDCLWLIDTIIDSAQGLPIGNYTSQWFANFYLEGLDRFIKQELGVRYYIRYVDDLVLLGPNKKKLHAARRAIANYLSGIGLQLKGNWQVFRVDDRGIDFLGLRFFRTHTILRKRNALRIRRRMRKIARKGHLSYRDACAVISYWGWIKRSNSYGFYHKYVKPVCSIGKAKEAVSKYAKIRNNQGRETAPGAGRHTGCEACSVRGDPGV